MILLLLGQVVGQNPLACVGNLATFVSIQNQCPLPIKSSNVDPALMTNANFEKLCSSTCRDGYNIVKDIQSNCGDQTVPVSERQVKVSQVSAFLPGFFDTSCFKQGSDYCPVDFYNRLVAAGYDPNNQNTQVTALLKVIGNKDNCNPCSKKIRDLVFQLPFTLSAQEKSAVDAAVVAYDNTCNTVVQTKNGAFSTRFSLSSLFLLI